MGLSLLMAQPQQPPGAPPAGMMAPQPGGLFGAPQPTSAPSSSGLFGAPQPTSAPQPGGLFGAP